MGSISTEPVTSDDDSRRSYSPADQERLVRNHERLLTDIHAGEYSERRLETDLLDELHRRIFLAVREYAGQHRASGIGSEFVVFGPHRSLPNDQVPAALENILAEARKSLTSLESNRDDAEYELAAIRLAAWLHAKVIRVHPYEDGNGRTSRALMSLVLVRLGMLPIPIEAPKEEYLAALNHYYVTRDLEPFTDLCLRLYPL